MWPSDIARKYQLQAAAQGIWSIIKSQALNNLTALKEELSYFDADQMDFKPLLSFQQAAKSYYSKGF
ncbi:MAG: hypothetical protein AB8B62_02720 [Roseobacter sp.]